MFRISPEIHLYHCQEVSPAPLDTIWHRKLRKITMRLNIESEPSVWGYLHKIVRCLRIWGGGPHIPIEDILSDFDIRVGTPQTILRCWRSRGTPNIPIEGI